MWKKLLQRFLTSMLGVVVVCAWLVAGSVAAQAQLVTAQSLPLIIQAHINWINKRRPDFAKILTREFDRIDKSKLTDKQKHAARLRLLVKILKEAQDAKNIADKLGNSKQRLMALTVFHELKSLIAVIHSSQDIGRNVPTYVISPEWIVDEYQRLVLKAEKKKREAEKKKSAGSQGTDTQQSSAATAPALSVTANARAGKVNRRKVSFLRTEFGGFVGNLHFGEVDRKDTIVGFDTTIEYTFPTTTFLGQNLRISPFIGFSTAKSDGSASIDFLSANGNQTALLGPEGPTGTLGGGLVTAAGFGDVTDIRYSDDYRENIFRIGVSATVNYTDGLTFKKHLSFLYGTTDETSYYGGITNGGTLGFNYLNNIDSKRYGVEAGARIEFPFGDYGCGIYVDGALRFIHNNADGYTSFDASLNGNPVPGFSERQDFSRNKFDVGGVLGAGFTYESGPVEGYIGVEFETWEIPVVRVTGEQPAFIEFEDRRSLMVKLGFKYIF